MEKMSMIEKEVIEERNIEIKARIASKEDFENRVKIARGLTNTNGTLIQQHDVFFNSREGRLKLRYLDPPAMSELIYYKRNDAKGPKLSKYNKIGTNEPKVLEKMLALTNGIQGAVKKERLLFIHNNRTRIHLDNVVDLGYFIEFEVCLQDAQTITEGQELAEELMKIFNIKPEDLMSGAYFDELVKIT